MFNDLMQILIGIAIMLYLAGVLTGIGIVLLINKFVKDDDHYER